jgi:shikimate kinase
VVHLPNLRIGICPYQVSGPERENSRLHVQSRLSIIALGLITGQKPRGVMIRHRRKLVFLLGFMGSGKSTVGQLLAAQIGWPFIDLDATIEAGQRLTIREIFEGAGEAFFRKVEHAALTEAAKTEPAVIALGGGTFVQPANVELVRESGGATIWLDCGLDELRQRCQGIDNRPKFRDAASVGELYEQRLPYYRLAEYRVSTESVAPQEVVERILSLRIF